MTVRKIHIVMIAEYVFGYHFVLSHSYTLIWISINSQRKTESMLCINEYFRPILTKRHSPSSFKRHMSRKVNEISAKRVDPGLFNEALIFVTVGFLVWTVTDTLYTIWPHLAQADDIHSEVSCKEC